MKSYNLSSMLRAMKTLFENSGIKTGKAFVLLACFFLLNSAPAHAASSQWHDLLGGEARMVANLNPQTNIITGVVEVSLKPGWSTYWRNPGSAGLPPKFDFSRSEGISIRQVEFPTPTLLEHEQGDYAGYKKKVLFPFEAEANANGKTNIRLNLLIGICEKICIPAQASMKIDGVNLLQSDPVASRIHSFAKLSVPKEMPFEEIIVEMKTLDENTLSVKARHPERFGKPALFVEGPSEWFLTAAKLIEQDAEYATFKVDVSNAPDDLEILSEKLRFTLASGARGIEIQ